MSAPLVELRDIRAAYGGIEVLHGVDLEIPAGKVVALLGPNGAGKSTTLNVLCGLMAPTAGQVLITGPQHEPESEPMCWPAPASLRCQKVRESFRTSRCGKT